jgi:hypothetical protein
MVGNTVIYIRQMPKFKNNFTGEKHSFLFSVTVSIDMAYFQFFTG